MNGEATQARPWIVLIGGFLGSGKTSLIQAAARQLQQRGLHSVAIFNDQGQDLVDTQASERQGLVAREVTGGCFCCRYSQMLAAIEEARALQADVIFAEPVGSCTDISATVFAPLREEFHRYRVAPFTVLVDPARARELRGAGADPDAAFLFENQLREADLVCFSKSDVHAETPDLPGMTARRLSAVTGEGVAAWLDEILGGWLEAGHTTLEIDYGRYAAAEAALAWMNLSFVLEAEPALSAAQLAGPLLDRLDGALTAAGIPIVHLKLLDSTAQGWLKAALCANGQEPRIEGNLDASPAKTHEVLVNLRAKGRPDLVRRQVEEQLRRLPGRTTALRLECFSPAPPKPERRASR